MPLTCVPLPLGSLVLGSLLGSLLGSAAPSLSAATPTIAKGARSAPALPKAALVVVVAEEAAAADDAADEAVDDDTK